MHKEQPLSGAGVAGELAVLGEEDALDIVGGPVAATDVDEGARDDADHVVQEPVGFDLDGDEPLRIGLGVAAGHALEYRAGTGAEHFQFMDGAGTGDLIVRPVRFEAAEVVMTEEAVGPGLHGRNIEVPADAPTEPAEDEVFDEAVVDQKAVALGERGIGGVEPGRDFRDLADDHVVGQAELERGPPAIDRDLALGFEAGHLSVGVDSRVGAASAEQPGRLAGEVANGLFENPLDRAATRLDLPAGEVGAIVGQEETEIGHAGGR